MGISLRMKTTLEIPDAIFRKAKASAALRGIPLRQLVTEAIEEKVTAEARVTASTALPAWMSGFGGLADLHQENQRIDATIRAEFQILEPEDRS